MRCQTCDGRGYIADTKLVRASDLELKKLCRTLPVCEDCAGSGIVYCCEGEDTTLRRSVE